MKHLNSEEIDQAMRRKTVGCIKKLCPQLQLLGFLSLLSPCANLKRSPHAAVNCCPAHDTFHIHLQGHKSKPHCAQMAAQNIFTQALLQQSFT
ncbi:hypothetical protein DV515_00014047 [Chloebia gouldiae]|uniref:Uncharacterized protein n=1 Tax=Chloebia gouldiae TaxID=44316 RepID=A0A3L8S0M4_CHLGU|nr:hypothetical protein DV515_00014047 [Chloebia gouldiae]